MGLRTYTVELTRTLLEPGTGFNNRPVLSARLDSAAIVAELVSQTKIGAPAVNTTHWSAQLVIVPPDQPLIPVDCTRPESWATTRRGILADGVPIPDGWAPEDDSDHQGVFFMPDDRIVGPDGTLYVGSVWEIPDLVPTATGWKASGVARFRGVVSITKPDGTVTAHPSVSIGRFNTWRDCTYPNLPTDPLKRRLFEGPDCICTASGLSLLGGIVSAEDVAQGHIDHGLGLAVPKSNGYQSPAVSGDGRVAGSLVKQGMQLMLPPDAPLPAHPVARLIAECLQRFPLIVWDTAGVVSFRAEPSVTFGSTPAYKVLADFPWGSLQVLA